MSTDLLGRVTRGVRALADAVPVTPPDPDELIRRAEAHAGPRPALTGWRARAWRPRGWNLRGWPGPLVTAAAVLVILAAATLGPGLLPAGPSGPGAGGAPVISVPVAKLSLLTAPVSAAPPGPASLAYIQGSGGPRRLHTSQTVVVGVDGRSYRRVDLAEQRGRAAELGSWLDAPVLLSPDGTRLAVGSAAEAETLLVLDLRTGAVSRFAVTNGDVTPLAWSPDGTRIAYAVRPTSAGTTRPPGGDEEAYRKFLDMYSSAAVLELATGQSRPQPDAAAVAAFSPDGRWIATQVDPDAQDPDRRAVRIVDLADGRVAGDLPVAYGVRLAGPAAWSPDGARIAAVDNAGSGKIPSRVVFLPAPVALAPGAGAPSSVDAPTVDVAVLGWRSADRLLVTDYSAIDDRRVYELGLDGTSREVTRFSGARLLGGTTGAVQAAPGLVPAVEFRRAESTDRGPWPWWWRITLLVLVLVSAAFIALILHFGRRKSRKDRTNHPAQLQDRRGLWGRRRRAQSSSRSM